MWLSDMTKEDKRLVTIGIFAIGLWAFFIIGELTGKGLLWFL